MLGLEPTQRAADTAADSLVTGESEQHAAMVSVQRALSPVRQAWYSTAEPAISTRSRSLRALHALDALDALDALHALHACHEHEEPVVRVGRRVRAWSTAGERGGE